MIFVIGDVDAAVSIGVNLDGLVDWSASVPYVNLVRQSRDWGSPIAPWIDNTTFDPITGWPTSDFGMVLVSDAYDIGGRYILVAKGNSDVRLSIRFEGHIENKTYDLATNTLSATVFIPQNTSDMMLSFTNTTGPGLQNVSLFQLDYDTTAKYDITNLTLAHLSRFSIIRFMDWTNTNENHDVNWNYTTPLRWPRYRAPYHNPWDTIPMIINRLNTTTDVWLNMPFNATDAYILNVARLMLQQLKSSTNIYVEFSNEVWNTAFQQGKDNIRIANDSVYNHGDPLHLNYDNCSNPYYWAFRRTAYQIKRISDLFKTIFGPENIGLWKRVRPILAGQAVNIIVLMNSLDYLNAVHGPPSSFIHGIAIAPYFGLGEYQRWSNLTTDQVLAGLNSSIQEFLPENGWSRQAPLGVHATYAAWYGLTVYGYEGGPDMIAGCASCSLDAKKNATRNSRLTDLCVTYLNGWYGFSF